MIDIKNKTCFEKNCKTKPSYNIEGETKALYCLEHKKENMINVISFTCIEVNCRIQPLFNYPNKTKALYCNNHKKPDMIDIKNPTCLEKTCSIRPSFNYENGKKPLYCVKHRKDNMIDIINNICLEENCKTRASFNYPNKTKGLYCNNHKKIDMINVVDKRCKTELCQTHVYNPFYKGYCAYCYGNLNPDDPKVRNFKTKERLVVEYIRKIYPELSWKFDKIIEDACSKRRPDIYLDLGYMIIIIEVDENQHRIYENICENKRMMEISKDVGHRPIIFIRFNPDKYIDKNNKIIPSCFSITRETGKLKVNNNKKWTERLVKLEETINYWLENQTTKTIEPIQLFYDEN